MKLRHKLYYVFGKNFAFLNEEKHLLRVYKKKILTYKYLTLRNKINT